MQNPLFESLLKKVQTYENPQIAEQESGTPPKGTIFSDFVKSLAQIGTKLVDQYIAAIKSYPDTKIKKEYEKTLPDKLAAILASVDKTKTVGIQVDSLFKAVKTEASAFIALGQGDTEVVKFLKPWRESFKAGFNAYQQAVNSAMEYVKQQEAAGTAKMSDAEYEMISKAVSASIDGYNKSTQIESTLKDDWGSNEGHSYKDISNSVNESAPAIDQLISNKICVDFKTYNKIINEAKEDRVARRAAKAATIEGENLGAQIDGVLSVIGSRLSDPTKAKFKSLAMKDQFMSIATNLSQVQTELAVDDKELKNVNFDEINKQISNLKTLFDDKKKSFESTYAEEEKNTRSFKTLEVATPEVTKYLSDGDIQFGQLSILAQKAANLAAEEAKKPAAATGGTGTTGATGATGATGSIGAKVESAPVKRADVPKGKRNDEVKKFQDGVIAKYAKDKRISATDAYKKLKQSVDSGQGGFFGPRTDAMVKMLKAGFKLSDTGSDITKDLLDKINAQMIKESRLFEQDFDYDAAEKVGSSSSSKSSSSGSKGNPEGEKKPGVFNCVRTADNTTKISGGKAIIERSNKNKHTFNADGTYSFFYASKNETMEGTWKCTQEGFEAYTDSDKDTFYGRPGVMDWKSNMDQAEKEKLAAATKAAADFQAKAGEICKKILVKMAGTKENEEAVAEIFRDEVTTVQIFKAVENFWNTKWWPSHSQLQSNPLVYDKISVDEITKKMDYKDGKNGYSLRLLVDRFFDNSQKALLNGYLPSGANKF